jgi:rhodanese-related sulfurtransferase
MKNAIRILTTILLTIGFLSCSEDASKQKSNKTNELQAIYKNVDAVTFKHILEQEKPIIIDVRTLQEISSGTIEGAIHIDYFATDFISQVALLDKTKPIAVYCASGGRSNGAMNKMENLGFTEVYSLNRGVSAWSANGFAIVK